jgi:hypothetical protein
MEPNDSASNRLLTTPQNTPQPDDLQFIIEAWPHLPAAVKAGMLVMAKASREERR